MCERRGVYQDLLRKLAGKGPLWRPLYIWEDNSKTDLQEVGCGGVDWIDLSQERNRWRALVNAAMILRVA